MKYLFIVEIIYKITIIKMFENLENLIPLYGDKVLDVQIIFFTDKEVKLNYNWAIQQIPTQLDKLLELNEEVSLWYSNAIQHNNTCPNTNLDVYTKYLYVDLIISEQSGTQTFKISYSKKIKPEPINKSDDLKQDIDLIPDINLVSEYLDLEKESESNDRALYESCDNLLKKIYQEYLEWNSLISEKEEEIAQLKKFIPKYNTDIKYMGLFFSVNFELCNIHNNTEPKLKKKLIIEFEDVKTRYPDMYKLVKDNFLSRVSGLEELKTRTEIGIKTTNLKKQIKLECGNIDTWAILLFRWYWKNKLSNDLIFQDLQMLLANDKIFVKTSGEGLNSIYLFDNYKIRFIPGITRQFEFDNFEYNIKFKPFNMYPGGYTPKYTFDIICKSTGKELYLTDFSHSLKMYVDSIYNGMIDFILNYAQGNIFRE